MRLHPSDNHPPDVGPSRAMDQFPHRYRLTRGNCPFHAHFHSWRTISVSVLISRWCPWVPESALLETNIHSKFNRLKLWLESADDRRFSSSTNPIHTQPNYYNFCVSHPCHSVPLCPYGHLHADGDRISVTFSRSHENLQLPDAQLLVLHAACARVAHVYDTAEAFDELERDIKNIRVLAFDGSSPRLLGCLLTPFAITLASRVPRSHA